MNFYEAYLSLFDQGFNDKRQVLGLCALLGCEYRAIKSQKIGLDVLMYCINILHNKIYL